MSLRENKAPFIWSIKYLYSSTNLSKCFKMLNNINISCLHCVHLPTAWNNECEESVEIYSACLSWSQNHAAATLSLCSAPVCLASFLLWKYLHCCPILLSFNTKEKLFQLWRWCGGPARALCVGFMGSVGHFIRICQLILTHGTHTRYWLNPQVRSHHSHCWYVHYRMFLSAPSADISCHFYVSSAGKN